MKLSLLPPALVGTAALGLFVLTAQGGIPQPAQEEAQETIVEEDHEDEDPLHDYMETIEHGMKKLRRAVRDAEQHGMALELMAEIEMAALHAKLETPPMVANVPEAERAEFLRNYRKEMVGLVQSMLALELALLDGDVEKARELYGAVSDMEDSGHEEFTEDE